MAAKFIKEVLEKIFLKDHEDQGHHFGHFPHHGKPYQYDERDDDNCEKEEDEKKKRASQKEREEFEKRRRKGL